MSFKSSPKCKASEIKCKQTGKSALLIICGEQITISKYNSKTNKADNSCRDIFIYCNWKGSLTCTQLNLKYSCY